MTKGRGKERTDREFSITPVSELPLGLRLKPSFYDTILDSVMNDETSKIFKIEVPNKTYKNIYSPIDIRIQKRKLPLKIHVRNKTIYLEKFNSFDDVMKLRKVHKKKSKTE